MVECDMADAEIVLGGGGRTRVTRKGGVVFRAAGPWSPTVLALLRHLADVGFAAAPRVIEPGFDAEGRETISYIEGAFVHPYPWREDSLAQIGAMLRSLHVATESFQPPPDAVWRDWFGRGIGEAPMAIGHCDAGPWNIVARDGAPVALIDWEAGGPVDPRVELAQACWLNVQLHDDDIAARVGLPPAEARAKQVRIVTDAYGLSGRARAGFADLMIAYAIHDAANEAIEARIAPETTDSAWGVAWRTRAAAWMLRHRRLLENALA